MNQFLKNIKGTLKRIRHKMEDLVRINLYFNNISDIDAVDEASSAFFPEGVPARRTIGVSALPQDVLIQTGAMAGNAQSTLRKA